MNVSKSEKTAVQGLLEIVAQKQGSANLRATAAARVLEYEAARQERAEARRQREHELEVLRLKAAQQPQAHQLPSVPELYDSLAAEGERRKPVMPVSDGRSEIKKALDTMMKGTD